MSVFFGEIRQLGYVVPDIEAAMDYWSRVLGVGPFFYAPRVPVVNFIYRGEPSSPGSRLWRSPTPGRCRSS